MLSITTWLLLLSATAIGNAVTGFIKYKECLPDVKKSKVGVAVASSMLGLFVSFAGTLIAFIYAGCANWNWANTDEFA
jgi:hypothetical protein